MDFDSVYKVLTAFAEYQFYGVLLCRLLMWPFVIGIFFASRVIGSWYIKAFALAFALILYNFPSVVRLLAH